MAGNNQQSSVYPKLTGIANAEIVVIGGGIAGVSSTYHLSKAGHDVILLEKDGLCKGATAASSGVLYYGSGTNFVPAVELFGMETAELMWKETGDIIDDIVSTIKTYNINCQLRRPGAIMVAKTPEQVEELQAEHDALMEIGIETKLLSAEEMKAIYPTVPFLAGITFDTVAQIYPARFARGLAKAVNLKIYEYSKALSWKETPQGIEIKTTDATVTCQKVVFATNAEDYFDLKKHFSLESSIVLVSEPVANIEKIWPKEKILWSMEDQYDMIYPSEEGKLIIELYRLPGNKEKCSYYYPTVEFKITNKVGDSWAKAPDDIPIVSKINDKVMVAIAMGDQGIIMGWMSGKKVVNLVEGKSDWFLDISSHTRFK